MKARYFVVLALLVGVILVLAWTSVPWGSTAARAGSTATAAAAPVTLNINLGAEPPTLDPALAASQTVIEQLFIGLVDIDDATGDVQPELATSWSVSPDATVYTFTLRSDIFWTDGITVTAQDVRYGILRTLDPSTGAGSAYILYIIQNAIGYNSGSITDTNQVGVTALDDTHLRITLQTGAAYLPSILAMSVARPMPQWAIEANGVPTWTYPANIVTNGAYRLTEWDYDNHIILDKNSTYYDTGNVQIERIKMWMVTDTNTAWQMYLNGELDTAGVPSGTSLDPALSQEVHNAILPCTYYYGITNNKPPFNDVRVRKAFAMSVDKQSLVDNVTGGGQIPAGQFAPPGTWGSPDLGTVGLDYDPAAASALLQDYLNEKGLTLGDFNNLGITLMHNTSAGHALIAASISQDWFTNLGVTVTVEHKPWSEYLTAIKKTTPLAETPHVWRMGWCSDYSDENNWVHEVFNLWSGANRLRRGCLDDICNNQVSQLFDTTTEQAAVETDPVIRKNLYFQAEQLLAEEEAAYIPIYFFGTKVAAKPYLERTYPLVVGYDIATWRITYASATVGAGGGSLTSYDGNTTLDFPADAFTSTVVITHTPASGMPPGSDLAGTGNIFEVTAVYSDTGQAAQLAPGQTYTMTVQYTQTAVSPIKEDTLALYHWDGYQWVKEPSSAVDTVNDTVTAAPNHFSVWTVLGEINRLYLPLVRR